MLPRYAELHCKSNFSFLTGASHPEELVERAAALGYGALAITDECSLAGIVRAHIEAKAQQLHLLVGSEMRLTLPGSGAPHARLVLLAQTRRGYGNLAHWITVARRRAEKGTYLAHPGDVEGKVPNAPMLAGLPECLALLVPSVAQPFEDVFAHAMWLRTWFQDRAAIAIELLHRVGDDDLVDTVVRVAQYTQLPIVAAGDVLMHVRSRKPLQDTLTATRLAKPVPECGFALEPNAEQHLRSRGRLAALYQREWLDNTMVLAGRCTFSLSQLRYEYPEEIVPRGETPASHLRKLVEAGIPKRFPHGLPAEHRATIESELAVIAELKYEAYFLTVADIVAWAREQNILCQGRGSAANSLVCYCLFVTEVDPRRATLLFGRFISVERNEPPDIDIDFEHQRREEVIQYIYRKYGRHRAALTAIVVCYRPRSALRDAGRALGLDLQRIEAVSKGHHWFDGRGIPDERLRESGFDPEAPIVRLWMQLTAQLISFPRHLSQHPGGFVIAKGRMAELVPVENAAMPDRSVIQWDKDDLDALGLLKVDILAIGMLSAIRRALAHIGAKLGRNRALEMQNIPDGDVATYDMICRADTVGVFQIESRAQMSMLPRLKPRCYYDLVVEVAIVRPGPIQGGMVHPYLNNRHLADDQVDCPDELKPALMRTKGVPIFQEQVMQIALLAADFSAGEADALRRAMAAWKRRGGLSPFHKRLVGRMVEKGYTLEYAERIFKQIQGFGEYGFPESHAAGFALLAYVSSWIKCHHADAFLCGLLNAQPMGFYAPAQLVRDAREHGVDVRAVDVAVSEWESTLEGDAAPPRHRAVGALGEGLRQAVRLGLNRVKGLAEDAGKRIVEARAAARFASPEDLARRARLDAHALAALADAGALHSLTGHRHNAVWAVAGIDTRPTEMLRATRVEEPAVSLAAPSEGEETLADYRALGLTLNRHPVALLREHLARFKVEPAARLRTFPSGRLARASGLVTHRQRPETAKGTVFVTLEDETGAVNVIVWPRVAETQRKPLLGAQLLTVYGQWQCEGEGEEAVMHLVASRLIDHSPLLKGLVSRSRDFR
ncbi:MAG: error-prone DNA polymerase [Rhizobacter sp.]|nr:error-prone DNA polymerase [Rhizobacter sp.]